MKSVSIIEDSSHIEKRLIVSITDKTENLKKVLNEIKKDSLKISFNDCHFTMLNFYNSGIDSLRKFDI